LKRIEEENMCQPPLVGKRDDDDDEPSVDTLGRLMASDELSFINISALVIDFVTILNWILN
jgi:hypothetical protein